MYKKIFIFLIVLMMIFVSGNVFSEDNIFSKELTSLQILDISNDIDKNILTINYKLSNLKDISLASGKIENKLLDNNKISIMIFYFDRELNNSELLNLNEKISSELYKKENFDFACNYYNYFISGLNNVESLKSLGNFQANNFICKIDYFSNDNKLIINSNERRFIEKEGFIYIYIFQYNLETSEMVELPFLKRFFNNIFRPSRPDKSVSFEKIISANIKINSLLSPRNDNVYSYSVNPINDLFNNSYFAFSDFYKLTRKPISEQTPPVLEDSPPPVSEDSPPPVSEDSSLIKSYNKLSIEFNPEIYNENIVCETTVNNICYVKTNHENVNIKVKNSDPQKPLFLYTNTLTQNNLINIDISRPSEINNSFQLSSNRAFRSNSRDFNINIGNIVNSSPYFLVVKQENSVSDFIYFIPVKEDEFNKVLEYKLLQKILNQVYCIGCQIPDWSSLNLDLSVKEICIKEDDVIVCEPILDEDVHSLDCKYTGDLKPLCDFNIFNLEQIIGSTSIVSSAGTMSPKETFFLEIKDGYENKITNLQSNRNYQLFLNEKNNFGLSKNELAIFFAIIGGESSFESNTIGDEGQSFGLAQLHQPTWKTAKGFNDIKKYLPSEINSLEKYYEYFDQAKEDSKKSLYLGLAVFKYNLNSAKNEIDNFNSYTDIDKAFIMFYAHQFNIRDTALFFNHVNIPDDKSKVIINCDPKAQNIWGHQSDDHVLRQRKDYYKLGCIATVGSIRKLAWYLYAINRVDDFKEVDFLQEEVNLPYVMFGNSRLYIHPNDAPTTLDWDDAMSYCADMNSEVGLGYDDWYLPSSEQMSAIWNSCPETVKSNTCMNYNIQNKIDVWSNISDNWYWTKTVSSSSNAYEFNMNDGYIYYSLKGDNNYVRCVRDH